MLYEHEMVRKGLARWHNGRLVPIIRGGDQRADLEFPELPDDLTKLDDDELQALHDEFQTAGRRLAAAAKSRDAQVLGELTSVQIEEQLTSAADSLSKIRAEQESRSTEEETFDANVDKLAEAFGADTSDDTEADDEETDDDSETESDEDAQTETAAETASAKPARRPLPVAKRHKPVVTETDTRGMRSQVRLDQLSVNYGDQLDERGIGEVLYEVVRTGMATPGTKLSVAKALYPFPDSLRVDSKDGKQRVDPNNPRIRRALDEQGAVVASGAICAMPEPVYDVPNVSVAERPVRAGITSFQASRGAVIVRGGILMGDYADAAGHVTNADNEDGGSLAVKNCMRIVCPDPETVVVDSLYTCIEADNLTARSDPELMAAIDSQVRAEQARLADGFLLDRIKHYSNAVTGAGTSGNGGVVVHLAGDVAKQAAAYRSAHRMARGATLQAFAPDWLIDAAALDMIKAGQKSENDPTTRAAAEAKIRGLFGAFGVNVSFFLDGSSNPTNGQVFAHWANSTLVNFPATVEWFLFSPGTFLHLDAGSLDLGVVRDSTLNATNDFQIFAETWENVAFIGVESRVITSTVCPSGTFAAAKDLSAVC